MAVLARLGGGQRVACAARWHPAGAAPEPARAARRAAGRLARGSRGGLAKRERVLVGAAAAPGAGVAPGRHLSLRAPRH